MNELRAVDTPATGADSNANGAKAELTREALERYRSGGDRRAARRRLALATADLAPIAVVIAFADRFALSFGLASTTTRLVISLCFLAASLGALVAAVAVQCGVDRRRLSVGALGTGAIAALVSSIAATAPIAVMGFVVASCAVSAARAGRQSSLGDTGPAEDRSQHLVLDRAVAWLAFGIVVVAGRSLGGEWRITSILVAVGMLALTAFSARQREAEPGSDDARPVRSLVNDREQVDARVGEELTTSFGESMRVLVSVLASLVALLGLLSLGAVLGPMLYLALESFASTHHVPVQERVALLGLAAVLASAMSAGAVITRVTPSPATAWGRWTWTSVGIGAAITAAVAPNAMVLTAALAVALGAAIVVEGSLVAVVLASVPPGLRTHGAGVASCAFLFGIAQGVFLIGSLSGRYGIAVALVIIVALTARGLTRATAGALVLGRMQQEAVVADLVEDQHARIATVRGIDAPLLVCRDLSFSYGDVQVLFDVDLTVRQGEMVALLGTNGAGKSTLLNLVSGVTRPAAGSIRLEGREITTLWAQRRVERGIVQIPGGRAMFPNLTVSDNLLAHGYSLGPDRRLLKRRIDDVYAVFPRLAERRDQRAAALSGGERQMLALSKALLLRPRLLLVDELSLGLAPTIVAALAETVKRINEEGTAVVLVEQSVNVALSLVDHAYFMEKGTICFDGPAQLLLDRHDLLRSVFLGGVGERA